MNPTVSFDEYLAVTALKARYFRAADTANWTSFEEIFTADAGFDGYGFGIKTRDALITTLSEMLSEVFGHHQGVNPEFRKVNEQTIRGVWAMHDTLMWGPTVTHLNAPDIAGMYGIEGFGFYEDEYVLTPEGWRISFTRHLRTRVNALTDSGIQELTIRPQSLDSEWLS